MNRARGSPPHPYTTLIDLALLFLILKNRITVAWACFFRLWLATVNTLCPAETPVPHITPQLYTDEDIMKDPLTVLRCDRRVFRYIFIKEKK